MFRRSSYVRRGRFIPELIDTTPPVGGSDMWVAAGVALALHYGAGMVLAEARPEGAHAALPWHAQRTPDEGTALGTPCGLPVRRGRGVRECDWNKPRVSYLRRLGFWNVGLRQHAGDPRGQGGRGHAELMEPCQALVSRYGVILGESALEYACLVPKFRDE